MKNFIIRSVAVMAIAVLTAITVRAERAVSLQVDNDYAADKAGHYYVNMPKTGKDILTLTNNSVTAFKVYDDGGKKGEYSYYCDGYLTINVPEGYRLELTGTIRSDAYFDHLTVWDGANDQAKCLIYEFFSPHDNERAEVPAVSSSGASLTLFFHSDNSDIYDGLDLTVTVFSPVTEYSIGMDSVTGGTITARVGNKDVTASLPNQTVTLVSKPASGYLLTDLSVKDANNKTLGLTDMRWFTGKNTATFTMPASNVTVFPRFTNQLTADGGLYINMPAEGNLPVSIPAGVQSFKVYDNGGAYGNYSNRCEGYLILTAPTGCTLLVTGDVHTEPGCDELSIYDGIDSNAKKLLDAFSSDADEDGDGIWTSIGNISSTGRYMTLYFSSDSEYNHGGLNLTVTVIGAQSTYSISVNSATGGTVTARVNDKTVTSATINQIVTLTATPGSGYVLSELSVKDANNKSIAVTDMLWYTGKNTATFTMPASNITITPKFTNALTADGGLSINMPVTGEKSASIPLTVHSFKVYDDGGRDGTYSSNCNGRLILTAPKNYMLQLSGDIRTERTWDKLSVFDGDYNGAYSVLLEDVSSKSNGSKTPISTVTSSGRTLTIKFYTDRNNVYDGLDLTVTPVADPSAWSKTGENEYTILNATGWDIFCDLLAETPKGYFEGKTVKLGKSMTVTRMAGGDHHDFTGTFDGQGNTLTLDYTAHENYAAPFRYVENGCIIKNLNVEGTITTSAKYAAGIIACQYGPATISDCRSSVIIKSSTAGDGTHGGLVGVTHKNDDLTIEGCVFNGSILSIGETATDRCGGFVGWTGGTTTISNSLFAPDSLSVGTSESATFSRHNNNGTITVNNSYYTRKFGDAQGSLATVSAGKPANIGAEGSKYSFSGITAFDGGLHWKGNYYCSEEPVYDQTLTLTAATIAGESKYVTTFYSGLLNYQLPAGALAYTVKLSGSSMEFYRIGTESNIIPANTAVVILSDTGSVTLTKLDADPGITARPNDLKGSDMTVDNSNHDKYVLGISGGTLGFFKYSGAGIPAGKAYYTVK